MYFKRVDLKSRNLKRKDRMKKRYVAKVSKFHYAHECHVRDEYSAILKHYGLKNALSKGSIVMYLLADALICEPLIASGPSESGSSRSQPITARLGKS